MKPNDKELFSEMIWRIARECGLSQPEADLAVNVCRITKVGLDPDVFRIIARRLRRLLIEARTRSDRHGGTFSDSVDASIAEKLLADARHEFACLCTPAGVRASMVGLGHAEGSYRD